MIGQVMRSINNYFPVLSESGTFDITAHKIAASLEAAYLPGMYVYIMGTRLNDGVCKISAVDSSGLTVEDTLLPETAAARLIILAPPRDFLSLVAEIETFAAGNKTGISSESIDDYSVSYGKGGGWEAAFRSRLTPYRCAYNELEAVRDADIRLLQIP